MKTNAFRGLKRNNKGQMLIESVLIMVVLVGFFMVLTNLIKERKLIQKMVDPSVRSISNMTANGVWKADGCTAPGKSKVSIGKCHPNSIARSLSSDPAP